MRREAQIEAREEAVQLRAEIESEVRSGARGRRRSRSASLAKRRSSSGKLVELERREQGLADREAHLKQLQEELKAGEGSAARASSSASPA